MQREFNGLGQLITEYQAHGSAVNTSTTPKVQYAYSEMSGGANHSRLTSMTYPNGRVVDQRWRNGSTNLDRYQYGYDRDSNRTYRDNAMNTAFGEVYSYDGLNQLIDTDRGTLNSGKTAVSGTPSLEQSWSYDALGNWNSVTTNGTTQTRSHNQQNELTSVSSATTPTYDANGNMTTDETGKQFVYDAWNFLKVVKNSGGTTLETFNYDALKRKIQIVAGSTTDLYYSAGWQVIEERASGVAVVSYVWSPVYVDAMISRDRDSDNNGSLDERLYVLHDANFNVTGLVTTGGSVVERFTYEPFGQVEIRDSSWSIKSGGTGYSWLYLHQGGRLDSVSGLYAFRMREYSPTLGRWMTNDPIGYSSGSTNTYLALMNRIVLYVDPYGLCQQDPKTKEPAAKLKPPVPVEIAPKPRPSILFPSTTSPGQFPYTPDGLLPRWPGSVPQFGPWLPNLLFPVPTDPTRMIPILVGPIPDDFPASTIVCDGKGNMKVHLQKEIRDAVSRKDLYWTCVMECVIVHEESHIEDVIDADPKICVGVPEGRGVVYHRTFMYESEKKAYKAQIECLKKKPNRLVVQLAVTQSLLRLNVIFLCFAVCTEVICHEKGNWLCFGFLCCRIWANVPQRLQCKSPTRT